MDVLALIARVVVSLIFVLGLLYFCGFLMKRLREIGGPAKGRLNVISSVSVGPKERVVVIEVPGKHLVLGVAAGGISKLHEMSPPEPVPFAKAAPSFRTLLGQKTDSQKTANTES